MQNRKVPSQNMDKCSIYYSHLLSNNKPNNYIYFAYKSDTKVWNILDGNGNFKFKNWFRFYINEFEDEFNFTELKISLPKVIQDETGRFKIITRNGELITNEWFYDIKYLSYEFKQLIRKDGTSKLVFHDRFISDFNFTNVIKTESPLLFIVQRETDLLWNIIYPNGSFFFEDWYFKIDDISSEYCTFKAIDKNGTSIIKDQFYCTMAC